ncbi:MAG: hypothetical protein AB7U76_25825 [Pirellulales bacterium]
MKVAVLERAREHRRLDQIAQKLYWDGSRGCWLGCVTHDAKTPHESAERLFGIEQRIGYWVEAVFEGLPKDRCAAWVLESIEALPVGADLSLCHHHFGVWLLSSEAGLLTFTDGNRAAIEGVCRLHQRVLAGDPPAASEWSAAESAAESAARSAAARSSAAWSAAESAAWSAWSSAASASAARSSAASASAARSAAARSSAAWVKIAEKSLEIFRAAPCPAAQPMPSGVRGELCARGLWCPDGELVKV